MFGGSKTETAPFKGEPTRESLTQPPPGYQTPSPNYAYGTGPKESLNNWNTTRPRASMQCSHCEIKLISRLRDDVRADAVYDADGLVPS